MFFVLVEVSWCQNGREGWYIGVQLHSHQPIDNCCGDELMPVDAAVHDKATRNDCVISSSARKPHGVERNLEGAWHSMKFQAVRRITSSPEFVLN